MKKTWNFQLCPIEKDIISKGFRMDEIGQKIENEINEALPFYLKFHKVNKIVIKLGPSKDCNYRETMGVGFKQVSNFSAKEYIQLLGKDKELYLKHIIKDVFQWLIENFEDSDSFQKTKLNVSWL